MKFVAYWKHNNSAILPSLRCSGIEILNCCRTQLAAYLNSITFEHIISPGMFYNSLKALAQANLASPGEYDAVGKNVQLFGRLLNCTELTSRECGRAISTNNHSVRAEHSNDRGHRD